MFETHIHLSYKSFNKVFPYIEMNGDNYVITQEGTREKLIQRMKESGIEGCIEPAIDINSNELLLKLGGEYKGFLFPAVGNHPTRCIHSDKADFEKLKEYADYSSVVAIGETGLDYHYKRLSQHRLKQKKWFRFQIDLAHEKQLPLILHIRLAEKDAIRILRKNKDKLHGGVCHCFTYGADTARVFTELGFCIGIGGTLLQNNKYGTVLQEAVRETDIKYILIETDGPYVRPERPEDIPKKKWEKARNTSLILPAVIKRIAELKGMSPEEVERITAENAKRVFHI